MQKGRSRHARRPLIGVTLDAEQAGGWSAFPWYALRCNYLDAVAEAGGLPVALGHRPDLTEATLDAIDGLIVTGGAFDVDPALYGDGALHPATSLKEARTVAELALLRGALARSMPVFGVCGGMQLLAVALGGTLIQHLPDERPGLLAHEQPNPRDEAGHTVEVAAGTRLAAIAGQTELHVNSSHHQAVRSPGRAVVSARAPDEVIEAIEVSEHPFCLGVQWHPEFRIGPADRALFSALTAAAIERSA